MSDRLLDILIYGGSGFLAVLGLTIVVCEIIDRVCIWIDSRRGHR